MNYKFSCRIHNVIIYLQIQKKTTTLIITLRMSCRRDMPTMIFQVIEHTEADIEKFLSGKKYRGPVDLFSPYFQILALTFQIEK